MGCNKCDAPSSVILRKKDHYCNNCFLAGANHKFRACLGKNKILSKNAKVLLCISGGAGSTALLDLVHNAVNLDIHKKLRIIPYILHISDEADYDTSTAIISQCEKYGFSVYSVHISDYMKPNKILPNVNTIPVEDHDCKKEYNAVMNILSATAYNDFLDQVKRSLFISYAKLLDCKYVFTAETGSCLATKLLSNLAIGRGSQVQNNVGFVDQRDDFTKIIRPMKDITSEELDYYIQIKGLTVLHSKALQPNSLQTMISSFVTDLQNNFQSTISTVCKTADKIGSASENAVIGKICSICQSTLSQSGTKLTALEATNVSRSVSFGKSLQDINTCYEMFPFIGEQLCYGCSKVYSETEQFNLPFIQKLPM